MHINNNDSKNTPSENNMEIEFESKSMWRIVQETKLKNIVTLAISIAIFIVLFYFLNFSLVKYFGFDVGVFNVDKSFIGLSQNGGEWGAFGDFFGGIMNPILGFLSFIAILASLRIQSSELKRSNDSVETQIKELTKSTEALHLQKKSLDEQNKSIAMQSFKSTLFSLISASSDIVNDIQFSNSSDELINGRAVFKHLFLEISKGYKKKSTYSDISLDNIERFQTISEKIVSKNVFALSEMKKTDIVSSLEQKYSEVFRNDYVIDSHGNNKNVDNRLNPESLSTDVLEELVLLFRIVEGVFERNDYLVDHYLDHQENILFFIKKNCEGVGFTADERLQFYRFFIAQMSHFETLIFYYNLVSLRSNNYELIVDLVSEEKLDFFLNVEKLKLLNPNHKYLFTKG